MKRKNINVMTKADSITS